MTVGPELEAPRLDAQSDAITVAFGDEAADLYGVARLGLADGAASGLAILLHAGRPVAVSAEGGVEAVGIGDWGDVTAAGLDMTVLEPLRAWRLHYAGEEASLDLELTALDGVAELDPQHPAVSAGGMEGYEQAICVEGSATVHGRHVSVAGLGQRGHAWGAPDWDRIGLARTVSAWLGETLTVSLTAIRPAASEHHDAEHVTATILQRADGDGVTVSPAREARISTTYDDEGRQLQAGLELWFEEECPRRAAGEVICGTSLDLGRLRLDCAFFRWRMDGREGIGRYDVLRRVAQA